MMICMTDRDSESAGESSWPPGRGRRTRRPAGRPRRPGRGRGRTQSRVVSARGPGPCTVTVTVGGPRSPVRPGQACQ